MNIDINISGVVLKTEKLTLREFNINDLNDFYEYCKVPGVGEAAGWIHHKSIEESKEIIEMFIRDKKTFAIVKDSKVIGSIGIEDFEDDSIDLKDLKIRELGYVLSKDYWGMGLMSEAVKRVIEYLFDDLGLDAIACGYFVGNDKSKRVQEKMGFKYLKTKTIVDRSGISHETVVNILRK